MKARARSRFRNRCYVTINFLRVGLAAAPHLQSLRQSCKRERNVFIKSALHDVCGVRSASIGGRRSAFLAGRDNDENIQWVFIFISRVLSNPAAAFGESPGFDGSACVVASCQLPFAVASWFLVSGAVPVTSLATAGAGGPARARYSRPSRCHSLLF